MPKAKKKTSVNPLEHTHEDGTVHTHEGGDVPHTHTEDTQTIMVNGSLQQILSKEQWCKSNGIDRPGSNHAETEYAKYLASIPRDN